MTKRTLMVGLGAATTSAFLALAGARLARSSIADDAFAALDVNHDGVISRDEVVAGADDRFARTDTTGDGRLSADEIKAERAKSGIIGMSSGEIMSVDEEVRRLDPNRDGEVSLDEYVAGARRTFDEMDANHDGYLTKAELDAGQSKMKAWRVQDDRMAPKIEPR